MVHAQALGLVKRKENSGQEELVFLFQRECKSVDDRTQDLEQFGNAVEPFCLVDKLEEDIVDRSADVGPQVEKFPVDPV